MCFTSKRTRAEVTRIVSKVIAPVLREEIAKLKAEGKEALFAGVLVGSEPASTTTPSRIPSVTKMMGKTACPRRRSATGPSWTEASARPIPRRYQEALAKMVQETTAYWCRLFAEAGIPTNKLYPHMAAPPPIEMTGAQSRPLSTGRRAPAGQPIPTSLGEGFRPLYAELGEHGNPTWAGRGGKRRLSRILR